MKSSNLAVAVLVFLTLWSCQPAEIELKSYYYPIDELSTPLVYEYRAVNNDTLGAEYWYFQTVKTDSATFLVGNNYDRFFNVNQLFREEIVSNGSIVQDYFLYLFDTTGTQFQVPAEITHSNVYPLRTIEPDSSPIACAVLDVCMHRTSLYN